MESIRPREVRAPAAARDFGLEVVKVLILVDRQEGGKEAVAKLVPQVEAVFTISDLRWEDRIFK